MQAREALQRGMKAAAAARDALRPPRPGVVVLIYHRVGARTGVAVDLPTDLFDEQLARLVEHHRVVRLGEALERLADPNATGPDPVVVTFDDGTADFVDEALPVLARHRVPATLYVATAFVEEQRPFPDDGVPLTWAAAAEAVASGLVDLGSHTHRHVLLDRLPADEVADELDRSIELLGERTGQIARDFAYPKAVAPAPAADAEVRLRFRSAVLAGTRPNPCGATDLHRIWRSPIQRSDGMRWFQAKVDGGMGLEDDVRRVLNRRRYAGATS